MKCPFCQHTDNKVLDSRLSPEAESIRRRRECEHCTQRFTTYERVEKQELSVIKRDGTCEPFAREKLLHGLILACEKRPVKLEDIETLATTIESTLLLSNKTEIKSSKIGELVMKELAKIDDVAYVRFASVYKKFKDTKQFVDAIKTLKKQEKMEVQ